jgi:hypothetical protein
VDDGAWDAVMGALVADRPFLLALWPDANPVEQLLSPPAAEAMMRRCEEAMRAVDAIGRRHDEARARADVAHRALRRYIDAFATDRYRQRDQGHRRARRRDARADARGHPTRSPGAR